MANIKISELNPLVTIQDADVLPIVDNAVTKKVTAAILRSYTEGNSVLLTGAQTVAGIKTFTAQLASSVATGTAPFSVASTTKVTNLNADLLDGLSSADFALSTRTLTAGTGLTGGGDLTANRTFAIDSTVATLTGTQTLTNKTITSPVINEILDSNGNELLGFTPIASAVDYITIKNGIGVGVPLHISAAGSSTNTGLHLEPKGSGLVQISDGTDTTKGIRFRSSGSATSAVTLIDAVSSAGRVITLPNATGTLALTSDLTSYVPTTRTVSTTSPLAGGGNLGGDLTLSIPQSSGSVNGYLASTDFATFNAKQNAITLTTTGTSGAATLVGSTLNIPNYADTDTGITSLNGLTALTQTFAVGTSGTDFDISSATSTHTFNLPTASAANRGALSSADWTTFNNKQNALTNPITGTGTTNYLPKFTGASALGNSNLVSDANGQLGLGITPSAWDISFRALQIGIGTALYNNTGVNGTFLGSNFYYNGTDNKYIATGTATAYGQINGSHNWFTVASGTAGDTVNFTQAMTLTASGNLNVAGSVTATSGAFTTIISTTSNAGSSGQLQFLYATNANSRTWRLANDIDAYGDFAIQQSTTQTGSTFANKLIFSSTGAATFSSSVSTGGQVLVNTGTANQNTKISGSQISMSRTSDAADVVYFSKNTDLGANGTANINGYDGIQFRTQGAESVKLTIAESGAATFSAGVAISGATAPASGIEFPSTQVASASANNLDDYEEGTWTMGISFGDASVGITYGNNTGNYTKVGRQVTVTGYLNMLNKGSSTGIAKITGLPFTIANFTPNYSSVSLRLDNITFAGQFQGFGAVNTNNINLENISILGTISAITDANFANTSAVIVSLTYFV